MLIRILAIGNKMPSWVTAGYNEYAKRLSAPFALELIEIPAEKRTKNSDIPRLVERESEKLLAACKSTHRIIALDVEGERLSTAQLAKQLDLWKSNSRPIDLMIGGPDGLSSSCLQRAEKKWSLSPLTLPHPLVRIVLAEQIYRAFTILQKHPYHR
ncbi:23S rRNA (pseudouridine(1915)-N(3))-methyltransferase RlmH [Gammaproteobacteria bacterium SCGC AG-212-F23]|nr:23S rRNA (pseudouridine(1915)-N(3))-methyltransferase RlmH [Gammaproteobacteria bacterium SCGC AG-212-F23]